MDDAPTATQPRTPPHRKSVSTAHHGLRPRTPETPGIRPQKGKWSDGYWWCDCDPRRQAIRRTVKKDGPTYGHSFWNCAAGGQCEFFLWCDSREAQRRETGPRAAHQDPPQSKTRVYRQRALTECGIRFTRRPNGPEPSSLPSSQETPPLTQSSEPELYLDQDSDSNDMTRQSRRASPQPGLPAQSSSKRKQPMVDDDFLQGLDPTDFTAEDELFRDISPNVTPATGHRVSANSFITPSNNRTAENVNGLYTPTFTANVQRVLTYGETSNKRAKTVSFEQPIPFALSSGTLTPGSAATPSCNRVQSSLPPTSPSPATAVNCDVTADVMGLLRDQGVDPAVLSSVQDLLTTSARKAQGLLRSRDSARDALGKSNGTISSLQARIVVLENREQAHNSEITRVKAQLMEAYSNL
ncbi:hypothetical protein S7711_02212 [Stachybotrys chartarum IBT 7711]|uniref:GRF-type domain-containing protein n=1 Tax=Stachybotrys chartarum (strain CBS 109288 / IBT 7711) TaxID=1280523 RepID=A0A084AZ79_STACB|nr:hypothetical protein S7711_02212 [Stachybotrys chartarum IBT 7711]KFA45463.1 hypothetical protein S40293_10182 [Stachybotrys chartarum IBT 40293]